MQDSKLWMVLKCKLSRCGWFRPEFAYANRPLLEILFEIRKIRNESRHPAKLNQTEVSLQSCKISHSLKFFPKIQGAV